MRQLIEEKEDKDGRKRYANKKKVTPTPNLTNQISTPSIDNKKRDVKTGEK